MITVRSSLVLAAFVAMLSTAACIQPGEVDESQIGGGGADAGGGGGDRADATPGNPPPQGQPDAAPEQPQELTFTANIYPQLVVATCTGCHTSGGIASFLIMNDNADAVYGRFMSVQGRVNVDNPEQSLILRKPLVGSDVSHRAKLFSDTNNPTYKLFKAWIEQGAAQ
jgi:hypothetical protein